jgi:hypothetical protein
MEGRSLATVSEIPTLDFWLVWGIFSDPCRVSSFEDESVWDRLKKLEFSWRDILTPLQTPSLRASRSLMRHCNNNLQSKLFMNSSNTIFAVFFENSIIVDEIFVIIT